MRDAWDRLLAVEPWLALDMVRRVAAGMAALDECSPGWFMHVDVRHLDMASMQLDVLGQLFGGYVVGFEVLRRQQPDGTIFSSNAHGFGLGDFELRNPDGSPHRMFNARYDALNALWVREIIARRVAACEEGTVR